jgi:hypothetical protein
MEYIYSVKELYKPESVCIKILSFQATQKLNN